MKIRMRKRCDIPHSASHFQKSLIIASWLLTFLFTGTAFAQENRTITGIVRDVTGEPLIGASVIQKGTNNGVITDVDGNYCVIPELRINIPLLLHVLFELSLILPSTQISGN